MEETGNQVADSSLTLAWPLAADALDRLSLTIGNRDKARQLVISALQTSALSATCDAFIIEADDIPVTVVPPKSPSLRIYEVRNSILHRIYLSLGFWNSVFPDGQDAKRAWWVNNVFSTGAGSEPIGARHSHNPHSRAITYAPRCVAYGVRFALEDVSRIAAVAGRDLAPAIRAASPAQARGERRGNRKNWACINDLQKLADNGRLGDLLGDVHRQGAPTALANAIRDRFGDVNEEPSVSTLYRRAARLLDWNRKHMLDPLE